METNTYINQFRNDSEDLCLFITNDCDLYRQMLEPIFKNLDKKKAKGIYDHSRAIDAFMHLANAGAKKYVQDVKIEESWHTFFNVECRIACAEILLEKYENQ